MPVVNFIAQTWDNQMPWPWEFKTRNHFDTHNKFAFKCVQEWTLSIIKKLGVRDIVYKTDHHRL